MFRKKNCVYRIGTTHGFSHPLGALTRIPEDRACCCRCLDPPTLTESKLIKATFVEISYFRAWEPVVLNHAQIILTFVTDKEHLFRATQREIGVWGGATLKRYPHTNSELVLPDFCCDFTSPQQTNCAMGRFTSLDRTEPNSNAVWLKKSIEITWVVGTF